MSPENIILDHCALEKICESFFPSTTILRLCFVVQEGTSILPSKDSVCISVFILIVWVVLNHFSLLFDNMPSRN